MRIADRDNSTGAHNVTVRCIRCARRRQLSDVRADLDGPPFVAYFCDPDCVPHSTADVARVYMDRGWQLVGGTWKESH